MKLSRRHMLRGIGGAVLALPLLESFLPRRLARAQEQSSSFAVFFRQASGVACAARGEDWEEPERFWPTETGALTPESLQGRALEELEAHRSRLLVVGNVNEDWFDYGDGHANGALQGLTARGPVVPEAAGDSEADGESLDNLIGRTLNPAGRDSLFLYAGPGGGWLGGPCISYRASNQRRAAIRDPKTAYEVVAGTALTGGTAEEMAKAAVRQKSINDLVRGQMQELMQSPKLSGNDRRRLELHFNSIRELEQTLECRVTEDKVRAIETGTSFFESSNGEDRIATTKLHMDVAALAIACGYTRSVAIQFGDGNDSTTRFLDPESGNRLENYHYISHRRLSHGAEGDVIPNADQLHHLIDREFARMFKYLLDRLVEYQLPSGQTLLDAGIAVWYNDNGNGPGHGAQNVPFVIAGSAGGFFKQGEYVRVPGDDEPNHNRMLNTIGSAVGVRNADGEFLDDFGDPKFPKGVIAELMA